MRRLNASLLFMSLSILMSSCAPKSIQHNPPASRWAEVEPSDSIVAAHIHWWRSGKSEGRRVVVLNQLLEERIRFIAKRSPRFRAAWEEIQNSEIPVLIGTDAQLWETAKNQVGRAQPWAGLQVNWPTFWGGRVARSMVIIRLEWLHDLWTQDPAIAAGFLRELDELLIHEIYGHLAPVLIANDLDKVCSDRRNLWDPEEGPSCVEKREKEVHGEIAAADRPMAK